MLKVALFLLSLIGMAGGLVGFIAVVRTIVLGSRNPLRVRTRVDWIIYSIGIVLSLAFLFGGSFAALKILTH